MLLSQQLSRPRERASTLAWSVSAHGVVIALLALAWHRAPLVRFVLPGEASGTVSTVLYAPSAGFAPHSQTGRTVAAPIAQARITAPRLSPVPAHASVVPDKAVAAAAPGLDSLGEGDVRIALTSWFPQPKPDLHGLPHGFEGDVVVDVVIDASGHIRETRLVRGISPQVDNTVVATVEQWQFLPAERNGTAVASQQELLFHYGPV